MFTKTSTLLLAASALISISSAAPTWQYTRRQSNDTSSSGEVVYFTFQAAPVIFDFNLTTTAAGDKIYYTRKQAPPFYSPLNQHFLSDLKFYLQSHNYRY